LEDKIIDNDRVAGPAKKMKCAVMAGSAVDDAKLELAWPANGQQGSAVSWTSCLAGGSVQFCSNPLRDVTSCATLGVVNVPPRRQIFVDPG